MKLENNRFFSFFKENSDINFLKHKNLKLAIFAAVFVGFIITIILGFISLKENINFENKTTVEIPYTEPLEEEDIKTINSIASTVLNRKCTTQKTIPIETIKPQKTKIIVSFYGDPVEDKASLKKDFVEIINMSKDLISPKVMSIENEEEIFISNVEKTEIENFYSWREIIVFCIAFIALAVYFLIAFRKLNGFIVLTSYLSSLIFSFTAILALFFALTLIFDLNININFLLPIVVIAVVSLINQTLNTNYIFKKLEKIFLEKELDELYLTMSNKAINQNIGFFINNFLIFNLIPSVSAIILAILNYTALDNSQLASTILTITLIYFIIGLLNLLFSIFILTPIWACLKRRKPKKA